MCLILLHFQPCAGSEPDCNCCCCCCCLSNKYTYMQLRSPEVTKVNFHLSDHHYFSLPTLRVCSQQSIVPKSFRCNVQGSTYNTKNTNQTFQVFLGRNGHRVFQTKEEKDHPDCY